MTFKQWRDQVVMKITATLPNEKTIADSKQFVGAQNSFNVVNTREYTSIHGLGNGEWNIGHASRAPTYTWTLVIPVTSAHVELFRAFQLARIPFAIESGAADVLDLATGVKANINSSYVPKVEKWEYCYVNSCNKSMTQNQGEVPTYTIDGIAFRHTYKDGDSATELIGLYKELLGSGYVEAGGTDLDRATSFTHVDGEDRIW